jgi:hypothetical protein
MKKYMVILFILAVACAFSLSAVTATTFEKENFDGKFKMDVAKGSDFDRSESDGIVTYMDAGNSIFVIYAEDSAISPDMSDKEFDAFEKASGFEADGKDGDIRVYKKGDIYGAMAVDDGIIVVVGYDDRDDAIDMAKSIKFTK